MTVKTAILNLFAGISYIFKTRACEEQFAWVMDALAAGLPGMVTGARPRSGKTLCLRWVCTAIHKVTAGIPYLEVPCREETKPSEGGFFTYLLTRTGHAFPRSGRISDKRDRFTRYLQAEAMQTPHRTIILLLDEAQLLKECHYRWLVNVYNELNMEGVTMFVILVGQESIAYQRQAFIAAGRDEIVERFMPTFHQFHGIRSADELCSVYQQYDAESFPPRPSVTFTEHFYPSAYGDGFRVAEHAAPIWGEFEKIWRNEQRQRPVEIPVQYAIRCMELFLSSADASSSLPHLDEAAIASLVYRTGFSHIAAMSAPEWPDHEAI